MHKTGYLVNIPLSTKAKMFIPAPPSNSNRVFRIYCNKVTNKVLKKTGVQLGLNKNLTCHVARHISNRYHLNNKKLPASYPIVGND